MRFAIAAFLFFAAAAGAEAAPAKHAFGAAAQPSAQSPAAHGSYAEGCLAGGVQLPITGPSWQAMRLERNRNWGHPELIRFIERLGEAAQAAGWPGLLVGDVSQPRGGPMTSGHKSHQIGLDADIWMRPGYERELSRAERRQVGSFTVTRADHMDVNERWTPTHQEVIRAAAEDPAVARIFVHAAIKKEICRSATGDRTWLRKVRPWYGHNAHFHVRLACPAGEVGCFDQAPPPAGDGCDATLDWWFTEEARNPKPDPNAPKPKRRGELTLADLPPACASVLS
ncbi:MAG: penicillin-insensitive murein endopeptidase, partial [Pseudomonadota bacterium]